MGTSHNRPFTGQGALCRWAICGSRKRMAVRPSICNAMRCWRRACSPNTCMRILASGRREDRPGLAACLKALRPGDVLVVWKLDTTTAAGKLVFGILAALAEFESGNHCGTDARGPGRGASAGPERRGPFQDRPRPNSGWPWRRWASRKRRSAPCAPSWASRGKRSTAMSVRKATCSRPDGQKLLGARGTANGGAGPRRMAPPSSFLPRPNTAGHARIVFPLASVADQAAYVATSTAAHDRSMGDLRSHHAQPPS